MPLLRDALRAISSRLGFVVIRRRTADEILETHPWLADRLARQRTPPSRQPTAGDQDAPSGSDPRLAELRRRYALHPATGHTVWTPENLRAELDIAHFRADNAYVWQTRVNTPIQYLISSLYVQANDPLGLLNRTTEDGRFGVHTYQHGDKVVSRDLLDSIMELNFLEDEIGLSRISELTMLDIGAGYGRLAHRAAESLPNLRRYLCTDAVPESTLVSELYTQARGVGDKVQVVPLDDLQRVLGETRVDVALNIHSFSECSLASIGWWLDQVAASRIPWLFIVPNSGDQLVSFEADETHPSFLAEITGRGYELVTRRAKYHRSEDAQRYGLYPATYFLFRLID